MSPVRSSGRVAVFTLLYAAEGAPIGFIWWALPAMLRAEGVAIEQITGLTAVLLLPWVFKFAWAPLVDALRSRRWGFRAWIISAQVLMGLTLAPLIWLSPSDHFETWRLLLLLHAFSAATQDVAIDALAINSIAPADRGLLNGCMQAGMLTGRSLFGGGALLVAAAFGRPWMIAALVAWIWIALPAVLFLKEPAARAPVTSRARQFRDTLAAMFRTKTMWMGLAFALTSAAAFEATGQLAGPFLIDRGVESAAIGVFFGLPVVGVMLIGGLIGGRMSDRWGRVRSVAVFLAGFVAMIAALAAADLGGAPHPVTLMTLLAGMYFFIGLFTAASYALFMDLTDPRAAGTQFSTFMAATNGCESWSALAGGRIAGSAGYPAAFLAMSAVSLLSLGLLARLRPAPATTPASARP